MRYMGPMFYEQWTNRHYLNEDGTCSSPDVNYALAVADRNVRFWYLGGSSGLQDTEQKHKKPNMSKIDKIRT